jgi:hypothetical protein
MWTLSNMYLSDFFSTYNHFYFLKK